MKRYRQLTPGERYARSAFRKQGHTQAEIARALGRDRSTISREVRRNSADRRVGPTGWPWPMTSLAGDGLARDATSASRTRTGTS